MNSHGNLFFRNITHFTFDMGNGYVKSLVMPHPASLFLDTLYDPEAIIKTNGKATCPLLACGTVM